MKPVAIIGGGITGLTAAFRLSQRDIPFTVYEASGRCGGVIRSVSHNGFLAECGPNTILETSPIIKSLVDDLGLRSRYLLADTGAKARYIVRYGRPIPLPVSPLAMLKTPLFSFGAKLSVLGEPFRKAARGTGDESLADFVRRRLGDEFLDYAINPFVAGVYAGDPARLSVRHAFPKLEALEKRYGSLIRGQILGARARRAKGEVSKQSAPMFSFDAGLQVLPDTLRSLLHHSVRLGTRVTSIRQSATGWRVAVTDDGLQDEAEHSAVLLAIPAHQAAKLDLQCEGRPENLRELKEVFYPPIASVALGFPRDRVTHPLDGFGMLVPEKEHLNILGSFFSSSLFPNRAPEGYVTLTTFIGGVRAPHLVSNNSEALVETALIDLRKLIGVWGDPVFEHVSVYSEAIPQYETGYGRFKDILDNLETAAPGLFFAGHYRDGISVADCIVSGDRVATRIAAFGTEHAASPALAASSLS